MGQADTDVTGLSNLIDLASERLGGQAIDTSNEFFASKRNLVKASAPIFIPGKYTPLGKWMDGWESRRKREPGHDWCIVKLGYPGIIRGVNVDTSHFNGNQPEFCTIEAALIEGRREAIGLASDRVSWTEIIGPTPLRPSSPHLIPSGPAAAGQRFSHVRLNIHPDGGVARLRVYGDVAPDWSNLAKYRAIIDLASAKCGGLVIAANDMHFGARNNMIMPGRAANMGDGWETRRKRGLTWEAGRPVERDWAVVRLGHRGVITRAEVDTNHFKGNNPESCMIEVCDAAEATDRTFNPEKADWTTLVSRTKLRPHRQHYLTREINPKTKDRPWTHARLSIYPDGGISRFRLWGRPV